MLPGPRMRSTGYRLENLPEVFQSDFSVSGLSSEGNALPPPYAEALLMHRISGRSLFRCSRLIPSTSSQNAGIAWECSLSVPRSHFATIVKDGIIICGVPVPRYTV